jgi:hypothetical protein
MMLIIQSLRQMLVSRGAPERARDGNVPCKNSRKMSHRKICRRLYESDVPEALVEFEPCNWKEVTDGVVEDCSCSVGSPPDPKPPGSVVDRDREDEDRKARKDNFRESVTSSDSRLMEEGCYLVN